MSEELLTHRDLAVLLGVSETTIKSYRRKFPGSIPVANNGKPIRFKPEAGEICLRIRDLFSTGMSVEEVGARLNQEFGWRKPKNIESSRTAAGSAGLAGQGGLSGRKAAGGVDLSQSFATALGNMAKSMISLNQSQAAIIDTMKRIEIMLSDMGLGAFQQLDADGIAAEKRKNDAAAIDSLNELNKLTANIGLMLESANAALEESRKINQQQAAENIRILKSVEALSGEVNALSERKESFAGTPGPMEVQETTIQPAQNQSTQKVINLPRPAPLQYPSAGQANIGSNIQADMQGENMEVPRHILHLPLVVRLDDGSYISAGGKALGRVSLNDVKAMLAQSYLPPDNFTLRWEHGPEGLWAVLEQPGALNQETSRSLRFLVAEVTSSRGLGVLEIRNLFEKGVAAHPVEFCRFITDIVK